MRLHGARLTRCERRLCLPCTLEHASRAHTFAREESRAVLARPLATLGPRRAGALTSTDVRREITCASRVCNFAHTTRSEGGASGCTEQVLSRGAHPLFNSVARSEAHGFLSVDRTVSDERGIDRVTSARVCSFCWGEAPHRIGVRARVGVTGSSRCFT